MKSLSLRRLPLFSFGLRSEPVIRSYPHHDQFKPAPIGRLRRFVAELVMIDAMPSSALSGDLLPIGKNEPFIVERFEVLVAEAIANNRPEAMPVK